MVTWMSLLQIDFIHWRTKGMKSYSRVPYFYKVVEITFSNLSLIVISSDAPEHTFWQTESS